MNPYIGHTTQCSGVEEHRLVGGKGDGLRLLEVTNNKGTELTVSLDRGAGISRLRYKGVNMNYMTPCGYVAPAWYDSHEANWLKGFTAGFLTTCGLYNVGSICDDEGEHLPLHGDIDYTPAEHAWWEEKDGQLHVYAEIPSEVIFDKKLVLRRHIALDLEGNSFTVTDTVENRGDQRTPFEVLYHMNMGYPLLDEESIVRIPSYKVEPRDGEAAAHMDSWSVMEKPQAGFVERCYFHSFEKEGIAAIWQPKLSAGLAIRFNPENLDCFTEWKMMGVRDYVLGLEPGNCLPTGRAGMRESGKLKFLDPGESKTYSFRVELFDDAKVLESL